MLSTLLVAAFLVAAPPQEDGQRVPEGPPLVSLAELQVARYQPQHVDVRELYRLAEAMVGRSYFVRERGGYQSQPVDNISQLGGALVLYDTREYIDRMVESLAQLDQPRADEGRGQANASAMTTWEYTLSYLSLESAADALQPFRRMLTDGMNNTQNISYSQERRLIVVRDAVDRVKEIRELLTRIDVPQDQVRITCWLLQAGAGGDDVPLPADLAQHLDLLLPGMEFRAVGFAMLQSTVGPNREVEMDLGTVQDRGPSRGFKLSFVPVAYDRSTGSLTAGGCALVSEGGDGHNQYFKTDAVLRGGELTVIGASGSNPVLVAVRLTPVPN